jgi:very-short-patch-repair endonuclease
MQVSSFPQVFDMDGLVGSTELRQALPKRAIQQLLDEGALVRVVQGVYARATTRVDTRLTLRAMDRRSPGSLVGCLTTAADICGIGIIADDVLHVIPRTGAPDRVAGVRVHRSTLADDDVRLQNGVLVTSHGRTVADLARHCARLDAIAVIDLAARQWPEVLADAGVVLDRCDGMRGVRQARQLLRLADPLAESPMESRARLRFLDAGLPAPESQVVVIDRFGEMRLDHGWRQWKVAAEFDGACHDDPRSRRADRSRHNRLRALGWDVYIFTDVDVYQRYDRMCGIVRTALAAAQSRR